MRARSGWDASFRRGRVERVRATEGGFELDGEGPFAHVLVAPGHPGLARPAGLPGAVHAYEPHEYASKVTIVGAGMAAATEWLNALAAGADVISVRRREPLRRPLNVPRPLFSKRGLDEYHALVDRGASDEAARALDAVLPAGRRLGRPLIRAAERDGRFRVEREVNGAPQVIAATGLPTRLRHDPLLYDLVDAHGLETHDRWIVLAPDSTVPALTDDARTLSLAGVAGQWAFPAADTIAGAKYAARHFLRRVCRTR